MLIGISDVLNFVLRERRGKVISCFIRGNATVRGKGSMNEGVGHQGA